MSCGDYGGELIGAVSGGNAQDFVTCSYISDLGIWTWPLFAAGAIIIASFAATRSAIPPLILTLILGPFIVATMPAAGANLIAIAGLFTIPAVLLVLLIRAKQR